MAEEEVGPSMALGNQVVNGNCADLTVAANMIIQTMNRAIPV